MGSQPSKDTRRSVSSLAGASSNTSEIHREERAPRPFKKGTLQTEGVPPPVPPDLTKAELLAKYNFLAVDQIAVEVPPELLLKTIWDVVEYLIVTPDGQVFDSVSKVRALFRWLTSFDVYRIDTEIIPPEDSPLEYFMKIQCDLGDHAHMFYFLCQMADIPCVIINGTTKSGSYELGGRIDREKLGSQWNAVYVEGQWLIIDTFWALACADVKKSTDYIIVDSSGSVTRVFENGQPEYPVNEFYFLCDPSRMIYTHFPDEEEWQLLEKPIRIEDFENQIYAREQFWNFGMNLAEDYCDDIDTCVLKSNGETIKMGFEIPPQQSKRAKFKYALYQNRTEMETEKQVDIVLERFVRMEHTIKEIRLKLRFPITGRFIFDLFGADMDMPGQFDLICSYLIICSKITANHLPFPDTPSLGWGPNPYADEAGLVLIEPKTTILETHTGVCKVCIGMKGVRSISNILKNVLIDEAVLCKYAVARFDEEQYIVDMRLPEEGEYALKIYAKTKITPSTNSTELITFLIKFKDAIKKGQTNMPFPNVSGGLLGKKEDANKLKIKPLTYKTEFVKVPEGQSSFVFKGSHDVKLYCELSSTLKEASSRMSALSKVENDRCILEVDLPVPAEYSMNVFAVQNSDPKTIYEIHSYLIESSGRPIKEVHFMDDEDIEETISQAVKTSDGTVEIAIPEPIASDSLYSIIQRRDAKDNENGYKASVAMSKSRMMVNLKDDGEYLMEVYENDEESNFLKIACFTISKNPKLKNYHNDIDSLMKMLKPQRSDKKGRKGRKSVTHETPRKNNKLEIGSKSKTPTLRKKDQKHKKDKKHTEHHKEPPAASKSQKGTSNNDDQNDKDTISGHQNDAESANETKDANSMDKNDADSNVPVATKKAKHKDGNPNKIKKHNEKHISGKLEKNGDASSDCHESNDSAEEDSSTNTEHKSGKRKTKHHTKYPQKSTKDSKTDNEEPGSRTHSSEDLTVDVQISGQGNIDGIDDDKSKRNKSNKEKKNEGQDTKIAKTKEKDKKKETDHTTRHDDRDDSDTKRNTKGGHEQRHKDKKDVPGTESHNGTNNTAATGHTHRKVSDDKYANNTKEDEKHKQHTTPREIIKEGSKDRTASSPARKRKGKKGDDQKTIESRSHRKTKNENSDISDSKLSHHRVKDDDYESDVSDSEESHDTARGNDHRHGGDESHRSRKSEHNKQENRRKVRNDADTSDRRKMADDHGSDNETVGPDRRRIKIHNSKGYDHSKVKSKINHRRRKSENRHGDSDDTESESGTTENHRSKKRGVKIHNNKGYDHSKVKSKTDHRRGKSEHRHEDSDDTESESDATDNSLNMANKKSRSKYTNVETTQRRKSDHKLQTETVDHKEQKSKTSKSEKRREDESSADEENNLTNQNGDHDSSNESTSRRNDRCILEDDDRFISDNSETDRKRDKDDRAKPSHQSKIVSPLDLKKVDDNSDYTGSEDDIFTDSDDEEERRKQVTSRKKSVTQAIKEKNLKDLIAHLRELKEMEDSDDDGDLISEATKMVEVLKSKENLTVACNLRERPVLEKAIRKAKRVNYKSVLDVHIILANRVLQRLKRTERLAKTVLEMNQNALVELKMYQTPPNGVQEVLMATFLLLGEQSQDMKNWQSCKSILFKTGNQYIMRRISQFNSKVISKEVFEASKQLLAPITLLQIRDVSKGATSFYIWTKAMIEEIEETKLAATKPLHRVSRRQIPPRSAAFHFDNTREREGTIVMRI